LAQLSICRFSLANKVISLVIVFLFPLETYDMHWNHPVFPLSPVTTGDVSYPTDTLLYHVIYCGCYSKVATNQGHVLVAGWERNHNTKTGKSGREWALLYYMFTLQRGVKEIMNWNI